MATVFSVASDQAAKLHLGRCKTITTFFGERVYVHISNLPLVVTLIGSAETNVGMIHTFVPEINIALEGLRSAINTD